MSNSETMIPAEVYWGSVDGREVYRYSLTNRTGAALYVTNLGAAAQAWLVPDKKGCCTDILLGYDSLAGYEHDEFYIGTVVGRYANRIAGGKVVIEGQPYQLATRAGGYHLHGGVAGFNKKVFDAEWDHRQPNHITFRYTSADMEEGFPGNLALTVSYTLEDDNAWHIDYTYSSDKTTLVNITQHAYFNLSGHAAGSILDHRLQLNTGVYLPVNDLQVPSGELASVTGTPFDFTTFKAIGRDINEANEQLKLSRGYDHSFVLKPAASPELKLAATVHDPASGRTLEVLTTEPAVHVYTGNFLENVPGKEGAVYEERTGFCLETQHYPDAPNKPAFPSTVLKAGETRHSKTVFRCKA